MKSAWNSQIQTSLFVPLWYILWHGRLHRSSFYGIRHIPMSRSFPWQLFCGTDGLFILLSIEEHATWENAIFCFSKWVRANRKLKQIKLERVCNPHTEDLKWSLFLYVILHVLCWSLLSCEMGSKLVHPILACRLLFNPL